MHKLLSSWSSTKNPVRKQVSALPPKHMMRSASLKARLVHSKTPSIIEENQEVKSNQNNVVGIKVSPSATFRINSITSTRRLERFATFTSKVFATLKDRSKHMYVLKTHSIDKLVKMLNNEKGGKSLLALEVLLVLSLNPNKCKAIVNANAFEPLVKILNSTNTEAVLIALACLLNLTTDAENQKALEDLNAIPTLLNLLNSSVYEIKFAAEMNLINLNAHSSDNQEIQEKIETTFDTLALLLESNVYQDNELATDILAYAVQNDQCIPTIAKKLINPLFNLIQKNQIKTRDAKQNILGVILAIASNVDASQTLVDTDKITTLISKLDSKEKYATVYAKILGNLAFSQAATRKNYSRKRCH